jgi:hypothetical protein
MFITLNDVSGLWPSYSHFDYAALGTDGTEIIRLAPADPNFLQSCPIGVVCNIAITVFGVTDSFYILQAGRDNSTKFLTNGVSMQGYVSTGQYEYFAYQLNVPTNISIICTVLSGNPDIFVSTVNTQPSWNNYTWSSIGYGDEVVIIRSNDPNYLAPPGIYYISVYGDSVNTTFSIEASAITANYSTLLRDGQPQAGAAPPHGMRHFNFIFSNSSGTLRTGVDISVAPLSGDVDLYVSNLTYTGSDGRRHIIVPSPLCYNYDITGSCISWGVDPTTYTWSSTRSGTHDYVSIPPNEIQRFGQFLSIGVFNTAPDDPSGNATWAFFEIVAATGNIALQLPAGVAIEGSALGNQAKYYKFDIALYGNDLLFVANTRSGALSLYAAEGTVTDRPNQYNYTYNDTRTGFVRDDIIYVPWSSLSAACKIRVALGMTCPFYIGAVGSPNMPPGVPCYYTMLASYSGSPQSPNYLINGITQFGEVAQYNFQYYRGDINISPNQTIYIAVQNYGGSTALFANLGFNKTFPTNSTSADVYSPDMGGYERIIIVPGLGLSMPPIEAAHAFIGEKNIVKVPIYDGDKLVHVLDPRDPDDQVLMNKYFPAQWSTYVSQMEEYFAATDPHFEELEGAKSKGFAVTRVYCSRCPIYVTVGGIGQGLNAYELTYAAGVTFIPLSDDRPLDGVTSAGSYSYYAYQVTDPSADLTLTLQATSGGLVEAYVIVQSPSRPYDMPSMTRYQTVLAPWFGTGSVTFSHTDPTTFCVSADGLSTAAPCTYLIAVTVRGDVGTIAAFTLYASSDSGVQLTQLVDGKPFRSVVQEGNYTYFIFDASVNGAGVTPPVLISTQMFYGRTEMFITNQYVPRSSSSSFLPSQANPMNLCQWEAINATGAIYLSPTDPCYDPNNGIYTIGVLAATGLPVASEFTITASTSGERLLTVNTPYTNQFVFGNYNATYIFQQASRYQDLLITATASSGAVALLVRHDMSMYGDSSVPGCYRVSGGTLTVCSAYTWLAYGFDGAAAIYIPSSDPCNPIGAIGVRKPTTNASCVPAVDWGLGRVYVTVYGWGGGAQFSVAAIQAGSPITLSSGQPQIGQTGTVQICPTRDNSTGACTGSPSTWISAQGSFFTFQVPSSTTLKLNQYLLLEKLCSGNITGQCGVNLHVYVRTCRVGYCRDADTQPYPTTIYDQDYILTDALGALSIPYDSCYGPLVLPGDCVYYVSVFPICGNGVNPGSDCGAQSSVFRITFSGDEGLDRVPDDCFMNGQLCTLPAESTSVTHRYEAFIGDTSTPASLIVSACQGDVELDVCTWGWFGNNKTKCNPWSLPGPGNADSSYNTQGLPVGQVAYSSSGHTGLLLWGVSPSVPGASSTYQVQIISGNGPLLFLSPSSLAPTATRDQVTGSWIFVNWVAPVIINGGSSTVATNVQYTAYAFPSPSVPAGSHLETVCGMQAAYNPSIPIPIVKITITSNSINFTELDPSLTYAIAITATCGTACLMSSEETQNVAYLPTYLLPPGPPGPSSSPMPPGPGNNSNSSSAVIPAVVSVFVILIVLVGGYFGYRAYSKMSSGDRYFKSSAFIPSTSVSGGEAMDLGSAYSSLG